jgi:hypothetical protein
MRRSLSPNRRKAAVLAGSAAALCGSLNLLHLHQPSGTAGLVLVATISAAVGAMLTVSFGLILRDRRACSKS